MSARRRLKFTPEPATVEALLQEQLDELRADTRTLRDNLQVPTIHTFDKDADYIDPVQGEIFWNFPNQRSYIWHHERWRPTQPPTYHIKVFSDKQAVLTGDNKFMFMVSRDMDGFRLIDAEAYITEAGSANTIQIRNKTTNTDLLSTALTIDAAELTTVTAASQRVLTTNTVTWGNIISIDVDAAGGKGLGVILVWNPPVPA